MGKYMRKCKRICEIKAMEVANQVGVRTRAMAAVSSGRVKRRRRSRSGNRARVVKVEVDSVSVSVSPAALVITSRNVASGDGCCSGYVQRSCCSSDGSSEVVEERMKFVDLEVESVEIEASTRKRREAYPSTELRHDSDEMDSTAKPKELSSHLKSTATKVSLEAEIEEFFAAAEKDLHKQFAEKYNFDVVNESPLEGRYEWIQLKP